MKISKLFAITLQSKTRLIFFSVAVVYNLLLGLYLKDFLVLSPMLFTEYPARIAQIGTRGTACTMMELGGMWI